MGLLTTDSVDAKKTIDEELKLLLKALLEKLLGANVDTVEIVEKEKAPTYVKDTIKGLEDATSGLSKFLSKLLGRSDDFKIMEFKLKDDKGSFCYLRSDSGSRLWVSDNWNKESIEAMMNSQKEMGIVGGTLLPKGSPGAINDDALRQYAVELYEKNGLKLHDPSPSQPKVEKKPEPKPGPQNIELKDMDHSTPKQPEPKPGAGNDTEKDEKTAKQNDSKEKQQEKMENIEAKNKNISSQYEEVKSNSQTKIDAKKDKIEEQKKESATPTPTPTK